MIEMRNGVLGVLLFAASYLAVVVGRADCAVDDCQRIVQAPLSPAAFLEKSRERLLAIDLHRDCSNEFERAGQLVLMTNVVQAVVGTNNWSQLDLEASVTMIRWVLSFPAVKSDAKSIWYCARFISTMHGVSTNDYARELQAAYTADKALQSDAPRGPGAVSASRFWGPNRRAFERKWRPILEQNQYLSEFRYAGISALISALAAYQKTVAPLGRVKLDDDIRDNTTFTSEEMKRMLELLKP